MELTRNEAFQVLELEVGDYSSIDAAYRRLARVHHPDAGGDIGAMQRLNAARDALANFGTAETNRTQAGAVHNEQTSPRQANAFRGSSRPRPGASGNIASFERQTMVRVSGARARLAAHLGALIGPLQDRVQLHATHDSGLLLWSFLFPKLDLQVDLSAEFIPVEFDSCNEEDSTGISLPPFGEVDVATALVIGHERHKLARFRAGFTRGHTYLANPEKLFPTLRVAELFQQAGL